MKNDVTLTTATPEYPRYQRVLTAVFYAICATLIVIVNKMVLTSYKFPSFLALGLGQMVFTVVALFTLKAASIVKFPNPSKKILKEVWPLPLLFFGNIVFSLGGTKRLSLPMYVVLRRFSNLFIMALEYFILGQVASAFVQFTVYLMILGAIVAASNDLAFDLMGYGFIFLTNISASLSGVLTKQKLNSQSLDKFGLMFYSSLVMVMPTFLLACITGDTRSTIEFDQWHDPVFLVQFLMGCVMGFMVTYSTMLCTQYNSALTTSIVGVLKNLFIVYAGMFIGGDYVYSFTNSLGINISVIGGLMYSYATFSAKSKRPTPHNSVAQTHSTRLEAVCTPSNFSPTSLL